jgi:predicted  nucleic acid-binding Zn-ribbon protein
MTMLEHLQQAIQQMQSRKSLTEEQIRELRQESAFLDAQILQLQDMVRKTAASLFPKGTQDPETLVARLRLDLDAT